MYKKVTKIKRVTKKYTKPPFKVVEVVEHDDDDDDDDDDVVKTKVYGDTVEMDIPFFIKLLEHVHNKVNNTTELQAIAQVILTAAKAHPCLVGEEFEQIVS